MDASLARGQSREGEHSAVEWEVGLTLPLAWLSQRGHRADAADAAIEAAQAEASAVRKDVLLQLSLLFWTLSFDQANVEVLGSLRDQTASIANAVSRRVEQGQARPGEAIRVEVEVEQAEAELDAARRTRRLHQDQLRTWLTVPPGLELFVDANLSELAPVPDQAQAIAKARRNHPSLRAQHAEARSLQAQIALERSARIPALSVRGFAARELDKTAFGAGVNVDLPLWDWNSGRIDEAQARLAARRSDSQSAGRELDGQVMEAYGACTLGVATAKRYSGAIVPRADRLAAIVVRSWELGESGLLEVLDARRVAVETHRQWLAVLLQAQLDCARLRSLMEEVP